jgi:hypothetical protein
MRCRRRLNTSSATTSAIPSTSIAHHETIAAITWSAPTSPGACSPVSHPTTASSATVTATAGPRSPPAKTRIGAATSTTAATSQPTPLICSWCGSGGGSPVGRRRRARRTAPAEADCRR